MAGYVVGRIDNIHPLPNYFAQKAQYISVNKTLTAFKTRN
jgi:hypothetical protein